MTNTRLGHASPTATHLLGSILATHHRALVEAKVRLVLLFAFGPRDKKGALKGPALTHGGYPAAGMVKIVDIKHRLAGAADALVMVDADLWPTWSDAKRKALLDHELQHLWVPMEEGEAARDEADRPKLKIRKHDFHFGGFNVIAERHGQHSFEVEQVTAVVQGMQQLCLELGPADDVATRAIAPPGPVKGLRAMTIKAPHCQLITLAAKRAGKKRARKAKRVENRPWKTHHRGPIAIHCHTHWQPDKVRAELDHRVDQGHIAKRHRPTEEQMQADLGKVVAVADLIDCKPTTEIDDPFAIEGQYGFVLDNVRLVTPRAVVGQQKIWRLTPELTASIATELGEDFGETE